MRALLRPKAAVKFDNKEDWMVNGDAIMAGLLYEAALSSDTRRVSGQGKVGKIIVSSVYATIYSSLEISRFLFLVTQGISSCRIHSIYVIIKLWEIFYLSKRHDLFSFFFFFLEN